MAKSQLCIDDSDIKNPEAKMRVRRLVVPACLTDRPLVVGDNEQTTALHALEGMVQEIINEYEFEDPDGRVIEYRIRMELMASKTVRVRARNLKEAIDKAVAEFDERDFEMEDYDVLGKEIVGGEQC